jgi:AsmA protein
MRWIVRLIGVLVLLAVVFVGALLMLPGDRIARIAETQVKAQTGRDLSITGDVNVTLWPVVGVKTGPVTFGNTNADAPPMFEAKSAAIGVDATSLFGGPLRVTAIEADAPIVRLSRDAQGVGNWEFGEAGSTSEASSDAESRPITLDLLSVSDATVLYEADGTETAIKDVDLTLRWPDPNGAAEIDLKLSPANSEVEVSAVIDQFAGFLKGQVQPIQASVSTLGGSVSFAGRASMAAEIAGKTEVSLDKVSAFFAALGLGEVGLPDGMGQSVSFTGDTTLTADQRLALRNGALSFSGNSLSIAADVQLGSTPQVNAQIAGGQVSLAALTGGGEDAGQSEAGWSTAPIDASGLAAFNGDVSFVADGVDLGDFQLGKTRAVLKLDRSRAVFELREVQVFEGVLTGEFVMNNRNGLSVGGKLFAQSMALQPMLAALADIDRLSGPMAAEVSFLASGGSQQDLMNSLSGQGAIKLDQGTIRGINLDALMKTGAGGGTTVFDSLGAKFNIENGVLRNDDLLMLLPNYQAKGAGQIGIGARTIDYVFTPTALRANSGEGIAIPVRIVGPWADPSIRPDLKAAIDLNFAEEKERVEQQVKDQVSQKLQEELGVTAEEGQSVEDAVKDKVEDELKRGLRSLFD